MKYLGPVLLAISALLLLASLGLQLIAMSSRACQAQIEEVRNGQ